MHYSAGFRVMAGRSWHEPAGLIALLAAVAWVYRGCLNGFFVQDDFGWLGSSRYTELREYSKVFFQFNPALSYRPLSQETFFWLGQKIFGMWPPGFHFVSLACHLAGTALVYHLLRQFFTPPPSLAGALFYGVHSAHLTSVYWISAFPEPLALLFYVTATILFIRYDRSGRRAWHFLSLLAMTAGMMSKESVLTLPLVLAAYCLFLSPSRMLSTAPHFLLSGIYVYFRATSAVVEAAPYQLTFGRGVWQNVASYLSWSAGFSETLLNVRFRWGTGSSYPWIAAAAAVLILALAVLSRRKSLAGWALAWYLLALQPVLYFSDHINPYYLAAPLAGLSLLVASGAATVRWSPRVRSVAVAGLALVFLWLCRTSVRLEGRWWNGRAERGREILLAMSDVDRQVPPGRIAYILGFGAEEFGILQNDSAFKTYGFPPDRFIQVGINPLTVEEIRVLMKTGGLRNYYCFFYRSGGFENVTEPFRNEPELYVGKGDGGAPEFEDLDYLDLPGVYLNARPAILHAGKDTLRLSIVNYRVPSIDLLYTFEGKPMPPLLGWRLDQNGSASVLVSRSTPRGKYRYKAFRDSRAQRSAGWVRAEAEIEVR